MEKTSEELYRERLKRVEDAAQMKVPDRVPFFGSFSTVFSCRYGGITCEEAYFDHNKGYLAAKKTVLDFEPDMYSASGGYSGTAFETLGSRQYRLPGRGVPSDQGHQYIEGEYMKADEYDALLDDPTDYTIRTYLPRTYGTLEPLKLLRPLKMFLLGEGERTYATGAFALPEVVAAFEALFKAARELTKRGAVSREFRKEMKGLGFPTMGGGSSAPFDIISDRLRGMKGSMLDMYRQPSQLLEAQEKLLPLRVEAIVSGAKTSGVTRVSMPLHRGADGFMSPKQFETFYWPGLKKLVSALVNDGLTPYLFFEGSYNQRLEYLKELPKGKVVAWFDKTDMFKAKEVLGDTVCIMGNMPSSLLSVGTPQEVKDYSKKLIDVVGDGGGFIMSSGAGLAEAKPELVKIWIDFTKEYGVYKK